MQRDGAKEPRASRRLSRREMLGFTATTAAALAGCGIGQTPNQAGAVSAAQGGTTTAGGTTAMPSCMLTPEATEGLTWGVARSSGFVAFLAATGAVLLGARRPSVLPIGGLPARVYALHRALGIAAVTAMAVHLAALWMDGFVEFIWGQILFLPWTLTRRFKPPSGPPRRVRKRPIAKGPSPAPGTATRVSAGCVLDPLIKALRTRIARMRPREDQPNTEQPDF